MYKLVILAMGCVTVLSQRTKLKGMEGFIVGGRVSKIQNVPHSAFVSIVCVKPDAKEEEFACGSSILNQLVLLTAGHCLEDCTGASTINIAVGAENKRNITNTVSFFIIHEEYDAENMRNDVALMALKEPVKLGEKVKRVMITRRPLYKEKAILAGWGVTDEKKHKETLFLKQTEQKVLTRKQCLEKFEVLHKGHFCASGVDGSEDYGYAAVGDSGSALVVRGYIQIGLVSHKIAEYSASIIVYTDVPYYYEWILKTTNALYCRYK